MCNKKDTDINLVREGTAIYGGSTRNLRLFVQGNDVMICISDMVYFINLQYGGFFSVKSINEPMITRVRNVLKVLEDIKQLENIYEQGYTTVDMNPYKVPIPEEIQDITWKGDAQKNGRDVRSNYSYNKLYDVFQSLEDRLFVSNQSM